ncbi:complement resistance protein TraT [Halarcobacter anaerophilus]|jgi:PBP1b-binding outer membrane lipoprotein LpoB|uniref:Conjugal transfer protein TraT n=1 Tax=Halarcobacter anaerophilus TaxID=877500 RepID=A0A4Q0Y235_9BACT|nr:complement resistance protein TraT [Halarcobacter anaerophilus]QDF27815.1 putative TraT complement resistance protein [Halarcobacter anaerophilus]RXJ64157.1 conjugal transfer protein TraT [Halarcobacter anaerophilus]
MNKIKSIGLSVAVAALFFSGCATTELQTNAKMTQSIFVNPVAKNKRIIFVSSRNTSGKNINLESSILSQLKAKGYKIVDDPEQATYILMLNVLYCDKKQESNAAGGALAAGAAGAGVAGYNTRSAGSTIGVGLGTALIGGLISKALEDTIYQMQVDILIREKAKGKVYTSTGNLSGQANVNDSTKAGFLNGFGGSVRNTNATGQLNSNMANSSAQHYETNYIEHRTMLFAEATKMDLTLEEATPILEKQISSQITGLF